MPLKHNEEQTGSGIHYKEKLKYVFTESKLTGSNDATLCIILY